MPNYQFTESEVRLAFIVALAVGRPIEETMNKIFAAAAPSRTEFDKATGKQKPVGDSSRLATALNRLAAAGYMSR